MKLAIMQPYFMPYLGYFQLISAVDKFVIYDDVNYINKGWINRNNILVNEKATLVSLPLQDVSQNKLIKDIALVQDSKWKSKFIRTIELSYKKAPYFDQVFSIIEIIIQSKLTHINELALLSIISVSNYLQINTTFVQTSSVYANEQLKAQHRILNICKQEKASHYINPIGGLEIYSRKLFEEAEIKINFLKTTAHSYQQFGNTFVPNLSIMDVLMFNSKDEINQLLSLYELI